MKLKHDLLSVDEAHEVVHEGQEISNFLSELKANSSLSASVNPFGALVRILAVLGGDRNQIILEQHGSSLLPSNALNDKPVQPWGMFKLPYSGSGLEAHNASSPWRSIGGEAEEANVPRDIVDVDRALNVAEHSLQKGEHHNPELGPLFNYATEKILESVLKHVGSELEAAGRRGEDIESSFVAARVDKFQVEHFTARDIAFHRNKDVVRFDIRDLEVDLKLGLDKLRLLRIIPTLANKRWGKDATLLVKVRGGIGAGLKMNHRGEWIPDIPIDGGFDAPPAMNIDISLDICKGFNCVLNSVLPASVPFVKGVMKEELARSLNDPSTKALLLPFAKGFLKQNIGKALMTWSTNDPLGRMVTRTHARLFRPSPNPWGVL